MFDDFELQLPRWKRKKSYCGIYIDYVYYKHVFALFCASSLDASQAHRPRYLVEFSSNVVPSIKELSDKGHSDLMVFWGLKKMWGAQNCRILWCTITESVIFTVIRCWICSMVQTWISMNTVYIYIFYYYCFHYCYYYHLFFLLFVIMYSYLLLRVIIYYFVFYLLLCYCLLLFYYYLFLFLITYYYLLLCIVLFIIIYNYVLLFIMVYYVLLLFIIYYYSLVRIIIY